MIITHAKEPHNKKTLKYLSLFSGIEAASVAWEDLGLECVGVSEIDLLPCVILKHRYPNVPNLGDITKISKERINALKEKHGHIDIVVGGSPCQAFSIAGKRLGLKDPRGNLMFEYCRVVRAVHPKYFIWENVPGALSSNKGRDFSALIGEMVDIGYSLCWRVLDAQHFGVPQRRRRVFLVGCLGENNSAFDILFEREGSTRDLKSSHKEGQNTPTKTEDGIGEHGGGDLVTFLESNQVHATSGDVQVCSTLTASMGLGGGHVPMIVDDGLLMLKNNRSDGDCDENATVSYTLTASMGLGGGHVPMIVDDVVYHSNHRSTPPKEHEKCPTLLAWMGTGGGNVPFVLEHQSYNITFNDANGRRKDRPNGGCYINETPVSNAITTGGVGDTRILESTTTLTVPSVSTKTRVRQLTPLECERLQGFPDNWTQIPYNGKKAEDTPKSKRYKALGNSMAVPVMRFIGLGILEKETTSE